MRHLNLIPSRTRPGLTVSLELYQSPVILYNPNDDDDDDNDSGPTYFGLAVNVNSDKHREIGGITLVRSVLLRRRIPKSKRWGEWEEVQISRMQVVGECWVLGKQRFECSIPLPYGLPETRQTHYDQIIHLLTATIHGLAPSYDITPAQLRIKEFERRQQIPSHARASSSTPSSTSDSFRRSLATVQENDEPETNHMDARGYGVLATCKKGFEVVHCLSPQGDVPVLDYGQMLRLSDSGKVSLRATSDLFVLGSNLDVSLDFRLLTPDTTIHAISISLSQETSTPVKTALPDLNPSTRQRSISDPSPGPRTRTLLPASVASPSGRSRPVLARLSTFWASVKEKPAIPQTSVLDRYTLWTEGEDHVVATDHFDFRPGSCIWRGAAGRAIDQNHRNTVNTGPGQSTTGFTYLDDSKASHAILGRVDVTERTHSTMRLHRRLHLPSEIHGAHASSWTLAPVLAKVGHRLEVDIIYSILGQDRLGKSLNGVGGEGEVRLAKAFIEVNLASCSITPATIQPPSYFSPSQTTSRRRNSDTSHHSNSSTDTHRTSFSAAKPPAHGVHHTRSFRASNGHVIGTKRVFYEEGDMEEAVRLHRLHKGEGCACEIEIRGREGDLERFVSGSG